MTAHAWGALGWLIATGLVVVVAWLWATRKGDDR